MQLDDALERQALQTIEGMHIFKPALFHPSEFQPALFQPAEFHPSEFQPALFQPSEFQPALFQPSEFQPAEFQPVLSHSAVENDVGPLASTNATPGFRDASEANVVGSGV